MFIVARRHDNVGEGEVTGTRPDYLVNRVLTKNEGPHLKKIVRKSRNSCCVTSGGVGAVDSELKWAWS